MKTDIAAGCLLQGMTAQVLDAILNGSLRIALGGRYPLADTGRAHQDLQGRRTTGKLLLLPR